MTPRELAEKAEEISIDPSLDKDEVIVKLESLLAEAMEEAKENERKDIIHASYSAEELQQIRAAAFEESAKIVEEWIDPKPDWVINTAKKIRQRAELK